MAAMFRDFSFEAASRHPSSIHEAERAAMNVSPTSMPALSPPPLLDMGRLPTPPPCSVGELAQRFTQHNLRVEVPQHQAPTCYEPPTPPSDDPFAFAALSEHTAQQALYASLSPAALRRQRQANTRWQCREAHVKDISALITKMIDDGDQCLPYVWKSQSCSISPTVDDDEGVDMEYTPPPAQESLYPSLQFRRSGDRVDGHAMVSKSVRMRKKSRVTKRSSR